LWEQEVFRLLLAEGKLAEEIVANIRAWRHSEFSVNQSVRVEARDAAGLQRLIEYFLRCPFSQDGFYSNKRRGMRAQAQAQPGGAATPEPAPTPSAKAARKRRCHTG